MVSTDSGVAIDTLSESTSSSSSPLGTPSIQLDTPPIAYNPIQSLENFGYSMTDYERDEVHSYKTIYFTGSPGITKVDITTTQSFDDSKGNYRYVLRDHLFYRYEVLKCVGSGSFGMVFKCFDHKRQQPVAVKVVRNWPKVSRSAVIEVSHLAKLKENRHHPGSDCIVNLLNYFDFRGHRCVVFELLGPSLYDALKKRKFKGFIPSQVKHFLKPILFALDYLSQCGILHCDLKPENILFVDNDFTTAKLIDFGSATNVNGMFYSYIQSRFYRAPEVLMQQNFGLPIDMWSFGCIIVELITGTPVFAGENRFDQMTVIMEIMDLPSNAYRRRGNVCTTYFYQSDGMPKYCHRKTDVHNNVFFVPDLSPKNNQRFLPGQKTWDIVFGGSTESNLINLLNGCFQYEQQARLTPFQALQHPWLLPPDVVTID